MASRVPPQALEAEISILGGLMLEKTAWDEVSDILNPEDFYKSAHRKLFECIREVHNRNQPVDLITVTNYLREKSLLEEIGGTEFLVDLLNNTVSAANIASYVEIVQEKSTLRKMILSSSNIIEKAYSQDYEDISSFIDQAEAEILTVSDKKRDDGLTSAIEIVTNSIRNLEDLYKRGSEVTGVPTGFRYLDKITAGLHEGEMIILAARPSVGKTAFALNLALNAALTEKKSVAFFSLEMPKEQIMTRLLAQRAHMPIQDLRVGRIANDGWTKIINAAGELSECKLAIDDTASVSPFEIRAKCRRYQRQHGLDLVIIDYLQIMDLKQRVESRERAVSEMSRRLKAMAKELRVPVIALSQLSRNLESRTDRRPMLSDLRESGSIEQDADVVMMLYREDYYPGARDNQSDQGAVEVIVGKNRNGPIDTVKLRFDARCNLFLNPEPIREPPMPPPPQTPSPGGLRNYAPIVPLR